MLNQIHIRDLATIEEQHLQIENNCTMITGETGAGKSIFIEAIELALGGRASPNMIRPGKERADISLCFDTTKLEKVIAWLKQHDLYHDANECIIRRVIGNDGRSRSYINGLPTTLPFLRELGEMLFHLHGQHEQQVLLSHDNQRDLLDRYAGHLPLYNDIKQTAETWRALEKQITELRAKSSERHERAQYLRFQQEELATAQLREGEWNALEAEHHKLTHAEELLKNLQIAVETLADQESRNILSSLNDIRRTLETVAPLEAKAHEWLNTLHSCLIQLNDLEAELRNYLESTELDPERLHLVEQRVGQLFDLARKHKIQPAELMTFQEKITAELQQLDSSDTEIMALVEQQNTLLNHYQKQTALLSKSRAKAAEKLAKEITATIRTLSLPHGEFSIQLEKDTSAMPLHGLEKISFLIKTNPDQTLQPLAKVISGGELSRLSLAVHLALAHQTSTPTLIFDEVDTGIGGATAEKIGKLLRQLGDTYQVFCVTHQAQVAACGHHHLLVEKYFVDKRAHTRLRALSQQEKTEEIARMLGGETITQKTLDHAKEMVALT